VRGEASYNLFPLFFFPLATRSEDVFPLSLSFLLEELALVQAQVRASDAESALAVSFFLATSV